MRKRKERPDPAPSVTGPPEVHTIDILIITDGADIKGLEVTAKTTKSYILITHPIICCLAFHLEVASDSYCFLINSSWLLVFILYVFFMIFVWASKTTDHAWPNDRI